MLRGSMAVARKVRWEEMFPDDIEAAVAEFPVAWLPFGCLERHGPHMALGNDGIKAHAICTLTAQQYGGVVCPVSFVHMGGDECELSRNWVAGMGGPKLWGPYLPPELFYPMYIALLRQMEMLGFKVVMAITGHYGGPEHDMRLLAERYVQRSPLRICAMSDGEAINYQGIGGDHAGRTETSQLAYLRPDLVDVQRLPAPSDWSPSLVAGRDACQASAELGERIVESQILALGEKAQQLLSEYREWPGHQIMPASEILPFWQRLWAEEKERFVCQP